MKEKSTVSAVILMTLVTAVLLWGINLWIHYEAPEETQEHVVTIDVPEVAEPESVEPEATEPEAPEPELMPMEDFLDAAENEFIRKSYTKLFEIYDYEAFMTRTDIPHYFQTFYPQRFATGSIQTSGCGITCLSMVVSHLFDTTITPDMMLVYRGGRDPASAMEKGIREMQLNCERYTGMAAAEHLDEVLEEGRLVIALMSSKSIFTDYGHFILITGKTEDGRYTVNDPNLENYYKIYYKDEFMNGFTRQHITSGLAGIYIFDLKEGFEGDPSLLPNAQQK